MVYPLSVGNMWIYEREAHLYSYQDSSGTPEYEDTSTFQGTTTSQVTGLATLRDTPEVFAISSMADEGNDTYHAVDYYRNTDKGLYLHAYKGASTPHALPKAQMGSHILFKGMKFWSFRELLSTLEATLPAHPSLSDSLYFEDPPVKALHYPLEVGTHWTSRIADHPWRIDKQVLSKELVLVPAGTFPCYRIQWLYDMDADDQWDEDITVFDYISPAGLVCREAQIVGGIKTDEHSQPIGYLDWEEKYILTGLAVK